MKIYLHTLILFLLSQLVSAQNQTWGWGVPISANLNGSNLDCSVYDPVLNLTRTFNYSNVNAFRSGDGIVAWVTNSGTVGVVIYDMNLNSFQYNSSIGSASSATISAKRGLAAWVSPSGSMGAAMYDFVLQSWQYNSSMGSNIGNQFLNEENVLAWVSNSGSVGVAVYDPSLQSWQYNSSIGSNVSSVLTNADGNVAWVTNSGTVGVAIYDPGLKTWMYNSSISGNTGSTLINKEGVIAWISASGVIGVAVYDPNLQSWQYNSSVTGSGSNQNLDIVDGTVHWNSSTTANKYGYDINAQSWQSNINTNIYCKIFSSSASGTAPLMVYFWCLSIGANSYLYDCDDGNYKSVRWVWHKYNSQGNYNPLLTIHNSSFNSNCNMQLQVNPGADIDDLANAKMFSLTPNPSNGVFILNAEKIISKSGGVNIELFNSLGDKILSRYSSAGKTILDLSDFTEGIYLVRIGWSGISKGESIIKIK
jgi:hypothetical protein